MQESINILCLHGSSQSATAFESYMSPVVKMAQKSPYEEHNLTFHFIDAPFSHPNGGLTWTEPPLVVEDLWHDKDSPNTRTNALTAVPKLKPDAINLELLFQTINEHITKLNISVLLGFSQGAFVIYEYMRATHDQRIKRIVAMAGYTFDNLDSAEKPLEAAILNVNHPMDAVVPMSLRYTNSTKVYCLPHNNKNLTEPSREGHVLPTRAAHTRAICQFIIDGNL